MPRRSTSRVRTKNDNSSKSGAKDPYLVSSPSSSKVETELVEHASHQYEEGEMLYVPCTRFAIARRRLVMAMRHLGLLLGVYALSRSVFGECYEGLHIRFANYSSTVKSFAESTPQRFASSVHDGALDLSNLEAFKTARAQWHLDMRTIAHNIESKFALEFKEDIEDDGFVPVCESIGYVYQAFLCLDSVALFILLMIVLQIMWKDFCTAYGASRGRVALQLHAAFASVLSLVILNYPLLRLAMSAVDLSYQFKRALDQLKKLQVKILSNNPDLFHHYYLRASIWEGKRFGIREPLSGIHLDALFWSTLRYRSIVVSAFVIMLLAALVWRASVVRVRRWRRNVGAVCSIGIVPPNSKSIIRVGSGCIVQAGRAGPVLLTNWHCLRDFVDLSQSPAFQNRKKLHLVTDVDVRYSNTSPYRRSSSFCADGWKIIVGTADAGGPRWQFLAQVLLESPMREYAKPEDDKLWRQVDEDGKGVISEAPSVQIGDNVLGDAQANPITTPLTRTTVGVSSSAKRKRLNSILGGIDIAVLRLTEHILVHGIDKAKNNQHYDFEEIELKEKLSLPPTSILSPQSKSSHLLDSVPRFGDHAYFYTPRIKVGATQLRLLGYPPDAGGYDMSILTTWLTGVDFEDRLKSQGRYLLANTMLPRGFSGGAAVDSDGALIGICTAEHGSGISCIRDFQDLLPLIDRAERILLKKQKESKEAGLSKIK